MLPQLRASMSRSKVRNSLGWTAIIVLAVSLWIFVLIIIPQMAILEFSIRPNTPMGGSIASDSGYTLEHYRYFLGRAHGYDAFHSFVDAQILWRTLTAALSVTGLTLFVAYPLSWYLACVASNQVRRLMVVALVIPYWINDILRAYAFRLVFGELGFANTLLLAVGALDAPIDFIRSEVALYTALAYSYLLLMVFPLYNVMASQDLAEIEAGRDFGASWLRIHRRIVLPFAMPGIASGCTMVFMLSAGALAVPQVLGGPSTIWFAELIYQSFFESLNWAKGAAYAIILLIASTACVVLFARLFRVKIGELVK
jgi:spermidine/putrescine transport system permease protein